MSEKDPIVESVIASFQARSAVGIQKYKTTLADATGDWIQHTQEELMDAILYLERLKQERAAASKDKCPQTQSQTNQKEVEAASVSPESISPVGRDPRYLRQRWYFALPAPGHPCCLQQHWWPSAPLLLTASCPEAVPPPSRSRPDRPECRSRPAGVQAQATEPWPPNQRFYQLAVRSD